MDPLGATASIINCLELAKGIFQYVQHFVNGPKECQELQKEAACLRFNLENLQTQLQGANEDDPWRQHVRTLSMKDGLFEQYNGALRTLFCKVKEKHGMSELKQRLTWQVNKKITSDLMDKVSRMNEVVGIALQMDLSAIAKASHSLLLSLSEDQAEMKSQVEATHDGIKEVLADVSSVHQVLMENGTRSQEIQVKTARLVDAQIKNENAEVLTWLSNVQFAAQYQDKLYQRQQGTGQWLLSCQEYTQWLDGAENETLLCHGPPGAGKSVLAAAAVENILGTVDEKSRVVAYVFCDYKAHATMSTPDILLNILCQMLRLQPDLIAFILPVYKRIRKLQLRPTYSDTISMLATTLNASFSTLHIVIDALDEFGDETSRQRLAEALLILQQGHNVRTLIFSRSIPSILSDFTSATCVEIRASDGDLARFVAGNLPRIVNNDDEFREQVTKEVVEKADGMFLLAQLHMDSVKTKRRKRDVLSVLKNLPRGLDDAYSQTLDRIESQSPDDHALAKRTLSWLRYSKEPLTTFDLCVALSIEPGDTDVHHDDLYHIDDITSSCAGLVTVEKSSQHVRFVHFTVQEYFENLQAEWMCNAKVETAVSCLTFLLFDSFRSRRYRTHKSIFDRHDKHPFRLYAIRYWSSHMKGSEENSRVRDTAQAILFCEELVDAIFQAENFHEFHKWDFAKLKVHQNGLHLAARRGLHKAVQWLLDPASEIKCLWPNARDTDGKSPLMLASEYGEAATVSVLLSSGRVTANLRSKTHHTALALAAEAGHSNVVRVLLEHERSLLQCPDAKSRTPLWLAASNGHLPVVEVLLEEDFRLAGSADCDGQTPLAAAASNGHLAIVHMLLNVRSIDINAVDNMGLTALSWASAKSHLEIVRLLLSRGAVVTVKDSLHMNAIFWTIAGGVDTLPALGEQTGEDMNRLAVLRCLLSNTKEELAGSTDDMGRTPLSWAAGNGYYAVAQELIEFDPANVDLKDETGRTPLSWAAQNNHENVVRMLLATGRVDADSRDLDGRTPLSWAMSCANERCIEGQAFKDGKRVVHIIPKPQTRSGQLDPTNAYSATELFVRRHRPVRNQWPMMSRNNCPRAAVIKALLETRAVDANAADHQGRTPLSYAATAYIFGEVAVQLLLNTDGVQADAVDDDGRTPLSWATGHLHDNHYIVQAFMDAPGVDPNSRDHSGRTPLSWAAGADAFRAVSKTARHDVEWECGTSAIEVLVASSRVRRDVKDSTGRTPLDYAVETGVPEAVEILVRDGEGLGDCHHRCLLSEADLERLLNVIEARSDLRQTSKSSMAAALRRHYSNCRARQYTR